jgi:hypothetical protein
MKIISIRQPWAWLIVHGGKDIENRTWQRAHRGPTLIHASKGMTRREYDDASDFAFWLHGGCDPGIPAFDKLERGGIVGITNIVDCVSQSSSRWFVGPFGFVLRDTRRLPFTEMTGMLGFFDAPDDYQVPA